MICDSLFSILSVITKIIKCFFKKIRLLVPSRPPSVGLSDEKVVSLSVFVFTEGSLKCDTDEL